MGLLTDEIRAWIGREVTYTAPEPLSKSQFRYFALALDDPNPRWRSGEAPPTFVVESNHYMDEREDLLRGGHQWEIPVRNCRTLRGGHEYEFVRPVRAGDRITVTWRIVNIEERTSSGGTPMLIVTSTAMYRDEFGRLLAVNRETVIHQSIQ